MVGVCYSEFVATLQDITCRNGDGLDSQGNSGDLSPAGKAGAVRGAAHLLRAPPCACAALTGQENLPDGREMRRGQSLEGWELSATGQLPGLPVPRAFLAGRALGKDAGRRGVPAGDGQHREHRPGCASCVYSHAVTAPRGIGTLEGSGFGVPCAVTHNAGRVFVRGAPLLYFDCPSTRHSHRNRKGLVRFPRRAWLLLSRMCEAPLPASAAVAFYWLRWSLIHVT